MPPRHQRPSNDSKPAPKSKPKSIECTDQALAQAASDVAEERIVIELDLESPFIVSSTPEDDVTVCNPPPALPMCTEVTPAASACMKEAGASNTTKIPAAHPNTPVEPATSSQDGPSGESLQDALKAVVQDGQGSATKNAASMSTAQEYYVARGLSRSHIVHKAIQDLQASRHALWIGDSKKIFENCVWKSHGRASTSTLRWKADAPDKPADSDGDALIAYLGTVISEGSNMRPDGGWVSLWGEANLPKQKCTIRVTTPGAETGILPECWEKQLEGANAIADKARTLPDGALGRLGNCFVDPEIGTLRVRSPIFLKLPNDEGEDDDDDDGSKKPLPDIEEDTPHTHRYSTWHLDDDVRASFDRVLDLGYDPQILEAYSRVDKLIHPNRVSAQLSGAVVLVYCTLEKSRFKDRSLMGKSAYEVSLYANLAKVQVLMQPPPRNSVLAIKRKQIPRYGAEYA
ncbi:hypothetical protein BDV93DRAFT_511927 [Ceratobasidium sp. AG-I]|nr:hypothetical protein BDV93DRAFT_511927 [Ceratobasidium sp. AG-I]